MTKRKNVLNDDHFDGNDDHIDALKDAVIRLRARVAVQKRHFLLVVFGDVDPVMRGPFKTAKARDGAAFKHRHAHGSDDGLYRLTSRGKVVVTPFSGGEMEEGVLGLENKD